MLGFPQKSELRKPLYKKAIFEKLQLNTAQQEHVDADISRLYIVNEISTYSVGIVAGQSVKAFHVIHVILKRKDYDNRTITMLFRLIDNPIILVLEYEGIQRVAIFHEKLFQTEWKASGFSYQLKGLDLDAVWNNLIVEIGDIPFVEGKNIDERIEIAEKRKRILAEIARLEKLARAEKQPKKKFELVQKVNDLRKELE